MYRRARAAALASPWPSLLLFKLSWVLLVVWQDRLLLPVLLLQACCLWLHPALHTQWSRVLLIAFTGMALDQLLISAGVFVFPAGAYLPLWLALLWFAFALVLTQGLRVLQHLPAWSQSLLGAVGGPASYAAGRQFDAVDFGPTLSSTLILLALLWALLLPLQLRLARGWRPAPQALLTVPVLVAAALLALPGRASAQDLQLIGQATFRFMLWQVYDASLYAPSPDFRFPDTRPFALTLQYKRKFTRDQIVAETLKQWQQQQVTVPSHWHEQLASLLTDVTAGDSLTLQVAADRRATLSHNGRTLGHIDDPAFSLGFAGIWLAENTTEPEFRRRLLGLDDVSSEPRETTP